MPVIFNDKKLSPAPLFSVTRVKPEEKGQRETAIQTTLQMRGKLVSHLGSPTSSGTFWTQSGDPPEETLLPEQNHTSLLTKQRALKNLLAQQNGILELQPWDGTTPTKFVARLRSLRFEEGLWWNVCDYTADFDVDEQGYTNTGIESLNETWSLELADENLQTYRLVHTLAVKGRDQRSATGSLTKPGWEHARDYAITSVGLGLDAGKMAASGVVNGFTLEGYNYNRRQTVDEAEGSVSINEDWLCYDPNGNAPALHDYTVSKRIGPDGRAQVSVEGTITGLRVSNNTTQAVTKTKAQSMNERWDEVQPNLYAVATGAYGAALNQAPLAYQIRTNNAAGQLTYSLEYDNRSMRWAGSFAERVSLTDTGGNDLHADIVVPGRAAGPVMQDLDTVSPRRRSLNIEIQGSGRSLTYTPTMPNTNAYVASRAPAGTSVYLDEDSISFDEDQGRYTRNSVWTYQ